MSKEQFTQGPDVVVHQHVGGSMLWSGARAAGQKEHYRDTLREVGQILWGLVDVGSTFACAIINSGVKGYEV